MTPEQAIQTLQGRRTVPVIEASIRAVKELHARCLSHGIAAAIVRPPKCDSG